MAEPAIFGDTVLRGTTPKPIRMVGLDKRAQPSEETHISRGSPAFYDTVLSTGTSGLEDSSLEPPHSVGGGPDLMQGDASGGVSDPPSMSDQGRTGSNRRRSHSQTTSSRRPQGPHPLQTHSFTPSSPPHPAENIRTGPSPPATFHGPPPLYAGPSVPYNQRTGYVGQYTMSPQPPLSIGHTPPPFSYSHGFHHPGIPDGSLVPQTIHASYQPILQSHAPVYPYQRHSPENGSSSHLSYSGMGVPPIYAHHPLNPSPPPPVPLSSPPSTGQGSAHSPSYAGTGQFHSLRYPSPLSTPQYAYPTQSFPASPIYQPQYAPTPYPQHFSRTPEQEGQSGWWYLHHAPSLPSPQYEGGQNSYQGHYPMAYSSIGRLDMDPAYAHTGTPSAITPPIQYPMSSGHAIPHFPLDQPPSSNSSGPPMHESPNPGASASSGSGPRPVSEKSVVRRSYHPNPPAHRSEWVMWAGNVPSDATHDETWRFFNQPPDHKIADDMIFGGVVSIFLISRSSCAFINFETESHLHEAIARFNGQPLRPNDPRCARLVCRVRRKDDDLKAGVGGQRGSGMHIKWIKEQKGINTPSKPSTSNDSPVTPLSSPDQLRPVISSLSLSSDEDGPHRDVKGKSSSSGSYASTNSSILTRYFPKRYFILKSLTQFDLDLSVEKGLWATQKHNEGVLDQAYRTSREVYLIFGVNKSGEFYGYAKMVGPVRHGEHRVSWATRTTDSSPSSRSSLSPIAGRGLSQSETIPEEPASPTRMPRQNSPSNTFFSPVERRLVDNSPLPVSSLDSQTELRTNPGPDVKKLANLSSLPLSAPPALGKVHPRFSIKTLSMGHSLDTFQIRRTAPTLIADSKKDGNEDFKLDASAPYRAQRSNQGTNASSPGMEQGGSQGVLHPVEEEEERAEEVVDEAVEAQGMSAHESAGRQVDEQVGQVDGAAREEGWGESFKIEWISTERLSFQRTRHIRNPWNHGREVKVSRDGTELEPSVGKSLLEEWGRLSDPQPTPAVTGVGRPTAGTSKRSGSARSAPTVLVTGKGSREGR